MLVIAHRGWTGDGQPENTLAAVTSAFANGADGIEVDLRLTRDGVLILSHDPDLERLAGAPLVVATTPWPRLRDYAARHGLRLAVLDEVLVQARGARVVLELKTPPAGAEALTARALTSRLREARIQGTPTDVTVSSFSPSLLRAVRGLLPPESGIRTALLGISQEGAASLLRRALAEGHEEVHPNVRPLLAQPSLVEEAHAHDVAVVPWTVNRSRDLRAVHRLGVDGVITDEPALARAAIPR